MTLALLGLWLLTTPTPPRTDQGHNDEAAGELGSAAARFQSVRALIALARLQSEQHDLRGARESLRQSQMIAPNSEEVLAFLGEASLGARDPVGAILVLEPLTRICPTVARYPYLLGVSFLEAGDVSAAVESLKNAERLDPNGVLTLTALGLALNGEKAYSDAKKYLTRSLDFEPENVESLAALAESEEGLGDLAKAEALARRALAKVEAHVTANIVLGMVLMKQERYAEARDALERAVAASPMSSKAHYQLSLAYARLDDPQSSERQLELYRNALKANEDRLRELRKATPAPR